MLTPLKWMSNEWLNWFFVQENLSSFDWIKHDWYRNSLIKTNYKQLSFNVEKNGDIVIILKKKQANRGVRLSEGLACTVSPTIACNDDTITNGYWAKKPGKKI